MNQVSFGTLFIFGQDTTYNYHLSHITFVVVGF